MNIKKIISQVFQSDDLLISDDEDPEQQIRKYIKTFDIEAICLEGGFVEENYAVSHYDRYKDILGKIERPIEVCRSIIVLTNDTCLRTRDNARIQLQLPPSKHRLELSLDNNAQHVIGIDGYLLTNNIDVGVLTAFIAKCPPTEKELHYSGFDHEQRTNKNET